MKRFIVKIKQRGQQSRKLPVIAANSVQAVRTALKTLPENAMVCIVARCAE
jgi:tRNA-dihydrouridine synthase